MDECASAGVICDSEKREVCSRIQGVPNCACVEGWTRQSNICIGSLRFSLLINRTYVHELYLSRGILNNLMSKIIFQMSMNASQLRIHVDRMLSARMWSANEACLKPVMIGKQRLTVYCGIDLRREVTSVNV